MFESARNRTAWAGIIFALFFPTLLTFVYFVAAKNDPILQKSAYAVGKGIQFLFPALFTFFALRGRISLPRLSDAVSSWRGVVIGALFGLAVLIAAVSGAEIFASGPLAPAMSGLEANLGVRLDGAGLRTPGAYILLAVFYSAIHSGLEEYYWRWFVFGELKKRLRTVSAALIASAGFSLHHILVVGDYFGYASPLTWVATLAVFCGGLVWSALYVKSGSILGPWLSHGLIDAAIFIVGYRVLFC